MYWAGRVDLCADRRDMSLMPPLFCKSQMITCRVARFSAKCFLQWSALKDCDTGDMMTVIWQPQPQTVLGCQSKHLSSLRINLEQSNYCVCVIKPWASFVRLINCSLSSWFVCSSGYLCVSCVSCCERVVMIVTWQELQSLSLQDKRP